MGPGCFGKHSFSSFALWGTLLWGTFNIPICPEEFPHLLAWITLTIWAHIAPLFTLIIISSFEILSLGHIQHPCVLCGIPSPVGLDHSYYWSTYSIPVHSNNHLLFWNIIIGAHTASLSALWNSLACWLGSLLLLGHIWYSCLLWESIWTYHHHMWHLAKKHAAWYCLLCQW